MGNNPDLKFPLRAEYTGNVYDASGSVVFWATTFDSPAEVVRLANLAHEAEAVLELALQGMFHANECNLNPMNEYKCCCGHMTTAHLPRGFCLIDNCKCSEYQQIEPRCSCGTAEATAKMNTLLQKYGANHG